MISALSAHAVRRYPRIPGFEPVDAVEEVDYRPMFDRGPQVVGGYQLGQRLGTGTLGPCHEAWHLGRRAPAVVKLLRIDDGVHDRLLAERALLQNLQDVARLSHPRIMRLRDAGPTADGIYIAIEPAPGRTLEAALASGWRPTDAEAVALASDLASTLASAHVVGLVHGNLHGANVLLDDDHQPRLTDFGLLRTARHRAVIDEQGQRLPHRICRAPELAHDALETTASDTHALGVLLYRLLVDEVSFNEVVVRNWNGGARGSACTPLAELRPDLPAALCAWVDRAINADPSHRPDLAEGVPQLPTVSAPERPVGTSRSAAGSAAGTRRRSAVLWGFVALVMAGTVGVARSLLDKPPLAPRVSVQPTSSESFENVAGAPVDAGKPLRRANGPGREGNERPSLRLDH